DAGKAAPTASADADGGDARSGGATRLTVYSGDYESLANVRSASAGMPGYALVERPLRFELKRGGNSLSDKPLPPSM
ncbi:hypothetical protein AB4084_42320, partial [Lysobacter sp. 2RAB21]